MTRPMQPPRSFVRLGELSTYRGYATPTTRQRRREQLRRLLEVDKALPQLARRDVQLGRADGHPVQLAIALSQSAMVQTMVGNSTAARRDAEEIIGIAHRLGNPHIIEGSLGIAAFALGDSEPERALALAREAIALNEPGARTLVWAIAGDLADRSGQQHDALIYFGEAIDALYWFGNRVQLGSVIDRVASILYEDEPQTAAVLQGVGDVRAPGYTHSRHAIEVHERATTSIAASLDAHRRHALHMEGMTMTDAQAVDYTKSAISRYFANKAVAIPNSDESTKPNDGAGMDGHTKRHNRRSAPAQANALPPLNRSRIQVTA